MKAIRHICAALALICMGGASVFAQGGYVISGTVVDKEGPVIGAAVVEQGTHETLMAKKGFYYKLYAAQFE